jgi:hypothetical protein
MIFTFQRHITPDEKVEVKILANHEGISITIGILKFPSKTIWAKFYGALQSGSLGIKDVEVRMETSSLPHDTAKNITDNPQKGVVK